MSSEDARGAVGGPKRPRWTADEDQRLSELVRAAPDRARAARPGMWDRIALSFPDRTVSAVEHRWKDLNRDSDDARLAVGSDDAPPGPARRALRSDDATTRPFYGGGGRYCICAGAGRGEMVACDGGCSNWFHLDCLGLSALEVDAAEKWFCPLCAPREIRRLEGDLRAARAINRVRPLPRRRSSAIPPQPAPRPAAKRPRADQPAPKPKKKPKTKKPPPKPPAPEPPAPKRHYDPEEPCAICLEPLGDAPQLPGCSHRLHAACVLGPDSLASHAWAENRPSLRRGQQVVCPVCRKTSWIPPGFL